MDLNIERWVRFNYPVLSSVNTDKAWRGVITYSPSVIYKDGKYMMWFAGSNSGSRINSVFKLGYAWSFDGLHWEEYENNPVFDTSEISEGSAIQTPFVLFDEEENIYKMWFVVSKQSYDSCKSLDWTQKLYYAQSEDGLKWLTCSGIINESARGPYVLKEMDGSYTMWMNSSPVKETYPEEIYKYIFRYKSFDGISWNQDNTPVMKAQGKKTTCSYPCILKLKDNYLMVYGSLNDDGFYRIYAAVSKDGIKWDDYSKGPFFNISDNRLNFDGRYVSTPRVILEEKRLLLYYSSRDHNNVFIDLNGNKWYDSSGLYTHIGAAYIEYE